MKAVKKSPVEQVRKCSSYANSLCSALWMCKMNYASKHYSLLFWNKVLRRDLQFFSPILHWLNKGQKSSHLCQVHAYRKHDIHHRLVTAVMDCRSHLSVLRCEVFKGHDPGHSRLHDVDCTWRKTVQSKQHNSARMGSALCYYVHNVKQQLWANSYKP